MKNIKKCPFFVANPLILSGPHSNHIARGPSGVRKYIRIFNTRFQQGLCTKHILRNAQIEFYV